MTQRYVGVDLEMKNALIRKNSLKKVSNVSALMILKDNSGVDKIIVKKQPYQLLNTSCEFLPSFHALNIHKFDD